MAQTGPGVMTEESQARVLDIDQVLEEDDLFKLAIRGHAAVEEAMNATINEAFLGNTPGELTGLPFRIRLALFRALTQLPKQYAGVVEAVAQVRNKFAHGRLDDLTPDQVKLLNDALRPFLGDQKPSLAGALVAADPRLVLKASIRAAYGVIQVMADITRSRREQERKGREALKFQEGLRRLLSEHELK